MVAGGEQQPVGKIHARSARLGHDRAQLCRRRVRPCAIGEWRSRENKVARLIILRSRCGICQLHGATYTVDIDFFAADLVQGPNWVIDIGKASEVLSDVLSLYHLKNLDEIFPEENTTTEFMCVTIHKGLCERLKGLFDGSIRVTLWESHKAWASYHGDMDAHL